MPHRRSLVLDGDSPDALRRNEARFRSLAAAVTDYIWVTSTEGRLLTDMPSWRAITGQSVDELLGLGWLDGVHPDDRERTAAVWEESVRTEGPYIVEYRITGSGGTAHLDVRGAPVRDEDGRVTEWIGSCTDVTAQRRLASDIEDERETLRRVVEQARTAVVLLRGERFEFSHFNDAYLDMVPAGRAAVGVPLADALPETAHLLPSLIRVLEGETIEWPELAIAFDGPRAFDGFRYYHVSYTPITFAEGERGVLGVGVEVTEEVRRRSDLERRIAAERRLGAELQQALIPRSMPSLAGIDLAVRYRPASERAAVGGDWYDVIAVSEDRALLSVGDVGGAGLDAAGAMAQLRAAIRAHALEGHAPAAILDRVSRYCEAFGVTDMATVALVALDVGTGAMEWSSAGHPPPVLVDGDGRARLLWTDAAAPLGGPDPTHGEHRDRLAPDGTLVLYTDGLVQRRDTALDTALEELRLLCEDSWDAAADLRDALLRDLPRAPDDDVAVLVCRRPSGRWHHHRFDPEPRHVPTMRATAAAVAQEVGFGDDALNRIRIVVSEAATNAVVHSRRHEPGPVDLTIAVRGDELVLVVTDHGAGVTPRPDSPGAGVGVELIRALADRVHWSRPEAGGTKVTMAFALPPAGRRTPPAPG